MYLAIRAALFDRLLGVSTDEVAPWLREGGLVARIRSGGLVAATVGNMVLPNQPRNAVRQVPVFPYDLAGTNFDIWPAVSVYHHNKTPRRDSSYVFEDKRSAGVEGSKLVATLSDGSEVTGYGLRKTWPHGRPYDYFWRIRIWSRNETELLLIEERVIDLLDERGYLSVRMRNGTTMLIDTELQESPAPIVVPPGVVDPGDLGEMSKILTIRCEGYRDTTLNTTTHRTIRGRTVEMSGIETDDPIDEYNLDTVTSPE